MFAKQATAPALDPEQNSLHRKYRPTKLARYIGQEAVVTRVRGMIATGKIPNAISFFGPPSAGKTTLARIIAAETNGKPVARQMDYKELNAATQKGIDDVRELDKLSKFRAVSKRRFIVIDEAQQILTNKQAAQALLKPLEEPPKDTTWIICSMDPSKFSTTIEGKAILKRCTQFVLEAPSGPDLLKQAVRIAKGEGMTYAITEDKAILKEVVRSCDQDMRVLANLMQGLQQYYDGIEGKKPKVLDKSHVASVLSSVETNDDRLALQFMIAVYALDFFTVQRSLLDVTDGFAFMKKIVWMAQFMLNVRILEGKSHKKVWWSVANKELIAGTKKLELSLRVLAEVNARLIRVQSQAATFAIPAPDLLSSEMYYLISELQKK